MRTSILPLFCMVGSIIAAPVTLVPRDAAIIEISIRSVQASLQNLATLIHGLETHKGPDLNKHIAMITHHGQELSDTIRKGAEDIKRGPDVTLVESTALLSPVNSLLSATQTAVNAWIASKKTIENSGGKAAVRRILEVQKSDSEVFTKAMIAKMPYAVGLTVGEWYHSLVSGNIDRAINTFK
jgi:hypothetical protein